MCCFPMYSVVQMRLKCNTGEVCKCLTRVQACIDACGHHFQHLCKCTPTFQTHSITAAKTCCVEKLFLHLSFKAVVCYFIFSIHNILYGCGDLHHSFVTVLNSYNWIRQFEYFTCTGSINRCSCVIHLNCHRVKVLFNVLKICHSYFILLFAQLIWMMMD
jgi:hypothetical protein